MRSTVTFQKAVVFACALFITLLVSSSVAAQSPICPDNAGWEEFSPGSACGGGISNTNGHSGGEGNYMAIGLDGDPIVTWGDVSSGRWEIYVREWDGTVWAEMGAGSASGGGISNTPESGGPSVAVTPDGTPVVVWNDFAGYGSGHYEIYAKQWDGTAWVEMGTDSASGGGISNTWDSSVYPNLAISPSGVPVVAWQDRSGGGDHEIYVRTWDGTAWVEMGTGSASGRGISNNSGYSGFSYIAFGLDGNPIIAWQDSTSGDYEIYVRRWDGASWVEMGAGSASSGGISNNSGTSEQPSLVITPDGTPIITWHDNSSGNYEIYARQWDGTTWVELGTGSATAGGISNNSGRSWFSSLTLAADGTPIAAWRDDTSGTEQIYVRRWDGLAWVEMDTGSATGGGISNTTGWSSYPSLAVTPDGEPIVAWIDRTAGDQEVYVRSYGSSNQPDTTQEIIVFANASDGNIYSVEPDGSNLTQLTSDGQSNVVPRISPDGKKIAFCKAGKLYSMSPDGSNVAKLTDTGISCSGHFNWSPDSTQLLVTANLNATGSRLYIFDIATDTFSLVTTPNLSRVDQSDWSSDGSKVLVLGVPWALYVQNIDGTGQQVVASQPRLPAFSPDDSQIVYEPCCSGSLRIINTDGTGAYSLPVGAAVQNPRWSPDGSQIVTVANAGHLRIVNSDGSGSQVVPNTAGALHVDWGTINLNGPPTANAGGPYSGNEGASIPLSGATASDAEDTLTYDWSVDSSLCSFSDTTVLNPDIACKDNGLFNATLTVSDGVNDSVSSSTSVEVFNVAPTIDGIVAPSAPVNILDQPVTVTVAYSDPGAADTHDVSWAWGDLSSDTQFTASSPTSANHTYAEAGAYSVEVTVADDDGGSDVATYEFVVIYDPEGGFVTGGGWIDSEAGWCQFDAVCAGAEGKANFGFVSKYKKGAQVPTGNTQFNFKAGDFNFHSSEYDWLVVNQGGTNAQYKGSGTINGEGNYKFMLGASDGETDTFRIKIWYEDGGDVVVYDNGFHQPIGGGNIVVHTGK